MTMSRNLTNKAAVMMLETNLISATETMEAALFRANRMLRLPKQTTKLEIRIKIQRVMLLAQTIANRLLDLELQKQAKLNPANSPATPKATAPTPKAESVRKSAATLNPPTIQVLTQETPTTDLTLKIQRKIRAVAKKAEVSQYLSIKSGVIQIPQPVTALLLPKNRQRKLEILEWMMGKGGKMEALVQPARNPRAEQMAAAIQIRSRSWT